MRRGSHLLSGRKWSGIRIHQQVVLILRVTNFRSQFSAGPDGHRWSLRRWSRTPACLGTSKDMPIRQPRGPHQEQQHRAGPQIGHEATRVALQEILEPNRRSLPHGELHGYRWQQFPLRQKVWPNGPSYIQRYRPRGCASLVLIRKLSSLRGFARSWLPR